MTEPRVSAPREEPVILTREGLSEALDDAAARGWLTGAHAEALLGELLRRGGHPDAPPAGGAPIAGYDELSTRQVCDRLAELRAAQLRALREYERRHANRKSVLEAVDRALGD